MNFATVTPEVVIEIEQNVLGALMIGGKARDAMAFLRDHHFTEPFHGSIYRAITDAYQKYGSANPIVVKQMLGSAVQAYEMKTGKRASDYLAALAASTTSSGSLAIENARHVIQQWARVSISAIAAKASASAASASCDVAAVVHEAAAAFDDIMSEIRSFGRGKTRRSLGDAAGLAVESAMEAKDGGGGLTGVTWGLGDLNRLTGGIQRRDLTLIGARPSMGKTSLALSVALKAVKAGHGVGFFSLEMDAEKLGARALSDFLYDWNMKIPYVDIIRGNIDDRQLDALADAQVKMDALPLVIDDQSSPTVTDIRVRTERMMEDGERGGKPISVIFIDHLGLIKPSSRYLGNRNNEIGEITSTLKGMARDLDIAVVLLSQLSRAVESRAEKVPQLSDLRDSGNIEQDADMIGFLYREAYYLSRETGGSFEDQADREEKLAGCQNKLEFHIAKQRNGPVQKVDLFADMAFSAVRSGARQ